MTTAFDGEITRLRLITKEDFPQLLAVNNNPDIEQLSGGIYPMYAEELEEFYEGEMKEGAMLFMIEDIQLGDPIGEIGLHEISQRNQTAEIGITIFDSTNHRKGYASDALATILRYAFVYLSLRKISAWIYAPNNASIQFFEKHKFIYSGCQKAHRMYHGRYEDTLIYEIFRDTEYENTLG